ncbi:regulatory protein viviparous-1-like [Miscanthus floridulus]|uniref:regulatory protein viviparous-1-like n=1 Tax=Miscanthus floridulus TaxID=154761 RepID=UPI00345748D3
MDLMNMCVGLQGAKAYKNLRFLLQKVLKQSDVGSLGRIVLPKKEAEVHLPELKSRDGISIPMEDIGTSRVWNMRYRFWPNNKSRMYLLENTGEFVRSNELQEGDFIVIYSDVKSGKYLIRGVKVRLPAQEQRSGSSAAGKAQADVSSRSRESQCS